MTETKCQCGHALSSHFEGGTGIGKGCFWDQVSKVPETLFVWKVETCPCAAFRPVEHQAVLL